MKIKIITLILLVTLILVGKVEAFTLTQKLGSEYIETTVEKDETVRMIFTSKDGFRFKSWVLIEGNISINLNSNDITFSMPNENITIEAKYDTTYEITFNSNDGTGTTTSMSIVAGRTEQLDKNTFTREGYRFIGWSTEEDNTVEYEDEADCTPVEDLNLYAVWVVAEVTVQFNSDGGSEVEDKVVMYGEPYGDLTTPAKLGHTFDGWYKEDGTLVTSEDNVTETENHTLYAGWTINTYTIVYNGNGATSGSTASSEHVYGTEKTLTANGFVKTDYVFAGWATTSTGTETYKNEQSVINLTEEANKTITLYAKWYKSTSSLTKGQYIKLYDAPETITISTNAGSQTLSVKNITWCVRKVTASKQVYVAGKLGTLKLKGKTDYNNAPSIGSSILSKLKNTGYFNSGSYLDADHEDARFFNTTFWTFKTEAKKFSDGYRYYVRTVWYNGDSVAAALYDGGDMEKSYAVCTYMSLVELPIKTGTGTETDPFVVFRL